MVVDHKSLDFIVYFPQSAQSFTATETSLLSMDNKLCVFLLQSIKKNVRSHFFRDLDVRQLMAFTTVSDLHLTIFANVSSRVLITRSSDKIKSSYSPPWEPEISMFLTSSVFNFSVTSCRGTLVVYQLQKNARSFHPVLRCYEGVVRVAEGLGGVERKGPFFGFI
jgi:hypothetical protein